MRYIIFKCVTFSAVTFILLIALNFKDCKSALRQLNLLTKTFHFVIKPNKADVKDRLIIQQDKTSKLSDAAISKKLLFEKIRLT